MSYLEALQSRTNPDAATIPKGQPPSQVARPKLVWRASSTLPQRTPGKAHPRFSPTTLRLVGTPRLPRTHLPVPRKARIKAHLIESAYLVAALGTAAILWWASAS